MNTQVPDEQRVFNYHTFRLLSGIVVFGLPLAVMLFSSTKLSSISGSYYTDARDIFVGALFLIGAFLSAYNGRNTREKWISKLAGLAAILAALFPTSCNGCVADIKSVIHYASAIVLFSSIAYFCLGPFRAQTKGQKGKRELRARIYLVCGLVILGCIVAVAIAELAIPDATRKALSITFWAEFVALWAFGFAWIVAAKVIPCFADEEDLFRLSLK